MPAPVLSQALTSLRTRLAGINGAGGGYYHTVVTSELQGRIWDQVPDSERPYIGIQSMRDQPQHFPSRQVKGAMTVFLVCHLPFVDNPATRIGEQQELIDDIYQALAIDHTLGIPGITSTTISEWFVDGSDPLATHTMKVALRIEYRRPSGGSP